MDSAPIFPADETLSANLRMILRGLIAALGLRGVEAALALMVYRRTSRTIGRIERMLVRFRAGRLWRLPQRIAASRRRVVREPERRLPRRFGWLVQLGGHQAACFGSQLQIVLNTPEMAELLAVSAQAGRILRPLCRALAVELPGMAPVATTERAPRERRRVRPRVAVEVFRIPLPRGVVAAARRHGFRKDR